jgi:hypothetical protein
MGVGWEYAKFKINNKNRHGHLCTTFYNFSHFLFCFAIVLEKEKESQSKSNAHNG